METRSLNERLEKLVKEQREMTATLADVLKEIKKRRASSSGGMEFHGGDGNGSEHENDEGEKHSEESNKGVLQLPSFDGTDPIGWVDRANQQFEIVETPLEAKAAAPPSAVNSSTAANAAVRCCRRRPPLFRRAAARRCSHRRRRATRSCCCPHRCCRRSHRRHVRGCSMLSPGRCPHGAALRCRATLTLRTQPPQPPPNLFLLAFSFNLVPFSLRLKRPWPSALPSYPGVGDRDMSMNSPLAWLRGGIGDQGIQSFNFQRFGVSPYMQPRLDSSMLGLQPDIYHAMNANSLHDLLSLDPSKVPNQLLIPLQQNLPNVSSSSIQNQILQQSNSRPNFVQNFQENVAPQAQILQQQLEFQHHFKEQLLVQWKGQSEDDAKWIDMKNFQRQFPDFNLEDKVVSKGDGLIGNRRTGSREEGIESTFVGWAILIIII